MGKFGTAVNCIDGRVQAPVADWIKLHAHVEFVDMITFPGADQVLASGNYEMINRIAEKIKISIEVHQSKVLAVVGHFDCAANVVSIEEHKQQVFEGVELVKSWKLGVRVIGLYVNEWNSVDLVYDTDKEIEEIKSYL
jgi:S-adenosylhomocysteine hydrolase